MCFFLNIYSIYFNPLWAKHWPWESISPTARSPLKITINLTNSPYLNEPNRLHKISSKPADQSHPLITLIVTRKVVGGGDQLATRVTIKLQIIIIEFCSHSRATNSHYRWGEPSQDGGRVEVKGAKQTKTRSSSSGEKLICQMCLPMWNWEDNCALFLGGFTRLTMT